MYSEFAIEIVLLDIQRLAFGPLINAHLLYQAKIENLGVMRPNGCLIRIRVKMVAGKVCTLITVGDALLARTAEYIARLDVTQKRYCTFHISASFTSCLLRRYIESLRDLCS